MLLAPPAQKFCEMAFLVVISFFLSWKGERSETKVKEGVGGRKKITSFFFQLFCLLFSSVPE